MTYPICKGCGDQYPIGSEIPLCRYCLEEKTKQLEAKRDELAEVIKRQATDQVKKYNRITQLEDAIQFYLDLSKTGRVTEENLIDKFAYIEEATLRFQKVLGNKNG